MLRFLPLPLLGAAVAALLATDVLPAYADQYPPNQNLNGFKYYCPPSEASSSQTAIAKQQLMDSISDQTAGDSTKHRLTTWSISNGTKSTSYFGTTISLAAAANATLTATSRQIHVTGGESDFVAFSFTATGIPNGSGPLQITLSWFDSRGNNLDANYSALNGIAPGRRRGTPSSTGVTGNPPIARSWTISQAPASLTLAADNVVVPNNASTAQLTFQLPGGSAGATVQITNAGIFYGATVPEGFDNLATTFENDSSYGISVATQTSYSGGILFGSPFATGSRSDLNLITTNAYATPRLVSVNFAVTDYQGNPVTQGNFNAELASSIATGNTSTFNVPVPGNIKNGPYYVDYQVSECNGSLTADNTRFAVVTQRSTTVAARTADVAERARDDYPWGLWLPAIGSSMQTTQGKFLGELADAAGDGYTWFGIGGPIYLSVLNGATASNQSAVSILTAFAKNIAFPYFKKYGIRTMQDIEPSPFLGDSTSIAAEDQSISSLVSALNASNNSQITSWRFGTEYLVGAPLAYGDIPLDSTTYPDGSSVLGYNRQGTVRQYWSEYFNNYAAGKAACPKCRFGPSSADDLNGSVLRSFFNAGGTSSQIDQMGIDTYFESTIWSSMESQMAASGVPNLTVFAPEYHEGSWGSDPSNISQRPQETTSAYYVVAQPQDLLTTVPGFSVNMDALVQQDPNHSFTYKNRVRPMYVALANMTYLLGAGHPVSYGTTGSNVRTTVWQHTARTGQVALLYGDSIQNGASTVTLSVDVPLVQIVDIWGNSTTATPVSGQLTVPVSNYAPVYVIGANNVTIPQQ